MKRSFKPYQNKHNSVKNTGENAKKPCNIDLKISMKILLYYTHLPFLSSNPKILKGLSKTFHTKMKPINTHIAAKERKWGKESKKGERKRKVTVKTAVSLLNPKSLSKFCFLHMLELCKLIFCIWIGRPWYVTTCKWLYGKF